MLMRALRSIFRRTVIPFTKSQNVKWNLCYLVGLEFGDTSVCDVPSLFSLSVASRRRLDADELKKIMLLMGKDEAVALLLELANVEEAEYLKEQPSSAWPPPAAYKIVTECGLLPITLTIAAQVVRSWGDGWEMAVLPLLREKEGSSRTSTAEERVIGAGLKVLEKNKEQGSAVKELFHMLAVTQVRDQFVRAPTLPGPIVYSRRRRISCIRWR